MTPLSKKPLRQALAEAEARLDSARAAARHAERAALNELLAPEESAPFPPMAVGEFDPARGPALVPEGTALWPTHSSLDFDWYTTRPERLARGRVAGADYDVTPDGPMLRVVLEPLEGAAALNLADLDPLRLYLGEAAEPLRLIERLCAGGAARARVAGDAAAPVSLRCSLAGLDGGATLLPPVRRSLPGFGLLRNWFNAPVAFLFIDLHGLAALGGAGRVELLLAAGERPPLRPAVRLNCTPLVGLRREYHQQLSLAPGQFEAPLPLPPGFALYDVQSVGWAPTGGAFRPAAPWLGLPPGAGGDEVQYCVRRPTHEGGATVISVVSGPAVPRDSPLHLSVVGTLVPTRTAEGRGGRALQGEQGLACRLIGEPTSCRLFDAEPPALPLPLAMRDLVAAGTVPQGVEVLRRVLARAAGSGRLPGGGEDSRSDAALRQLRGVRDFSTGRGPAVEGPGYRIDLTLDESLFPDRSAYLFAAMLERFFAEQSLLEYTQLTARTGRRAPAARRSGRPPTPPATTPGT